MTVHQLELIAPNDLPIVSLKLKNGSFSNFEYSFDDKTQTSLYILPDGNTTTLGVPILVDSGGNEWETSDVEFHSLLHSR